MTKNARKIQNVVKNLASFTLSAWVGLSINVEQIKIRLGCKQIWRHNHTLESSPFRLVLYTNLGAVAFCHYYVVSNVVCGTVFYDICLIIIKWYDVV